MKILVEKAVIEQALEALEKFGIEVGVNGSVGTAITALREALDPELQFVRGWNEGKVRRVSDGKVMGVAEQAEQEPLMITPGGGAFPFAVVGELEQAEQEPVAWGRVFDGDIIDCICPEEHALNEGVYTIPLYSHPVRTKNLTDDELNALDDANWDEGHKVWDVKNFARAVIAKFKEKNK